ncbi:RimK family protein [Thiomicrorhabdus sp.]|uniref:RimK family protein n=1 Tax=Thiomicrorhabdus sp. TaxID=2039724 RepID=UPI0029C8D42D|nr:RimK family protein [Thiomicrorhabdus sp.]
MNRFYVVVERPQDWKPYYPSQDVITFDQYMQGVVEGDKRVWVINLCRDYRYLKTGYYCSLLAEARGHRCMPSLTTINDLSRKSLSILQLGDGDKWLSAAGQGAEGDRMELKCWFGQTSDPRFEKLAAKLFERFPCPLLSIGLQIKSGQWQVRKVLPLSLRELDTPEDQEGFANAFELFSLKMWRKPKARKAYRYDLAMLVNPEEALPPSDEKALQSFTKAANQLGIGVERIGRKDYMRLGEFDALFIRETTSVDHYTYRFAKKARAEGLVVIDDPESIVRCTNKIFLADLFNTHRVPAPKTVLLSRPHDEDYQRLEQQIGFPMVLKVPDGAFSLGVVKVEDMQQLRHKAAELLKKSVILLAQEFLYTQYDWRIGILNHRPLFACRYYMVDDHWQIYKHDGGDSPESGAFDTLPTFETPKQVLDAAVKAARLVGDGFYGVDLKQSGDRVVVIEVNDNPSIDSGVEDDYLGEALYVEIMREFLRRLDTRGRS